MSEPRGDRPLVDLVAPPMSGHLHPTLGIARRLARDVEVRVLSTAAARGEIAAAGLPGRTLLAGCDETVAAIVDPPYAVRSNPLRLHAQFRAYLGLFARFHAELTALWRERRPALVVADFTVPVAGGAAQALGIPWWTTTASPCAIETPDGPPAYLGGLAPRKGAHFRLRDAIGRALVRGFKRSVHRLYREPLSGLGFPAVYRADGSEAVYSAEKVLGLVIAELEFPRRWPAAVELVGPVLYTPPVTVPEPPFAPGRRHVLVTLGTHLGWRKEEVSAAVRAGARALPAVEFHWSDGERASERRVSDGNFHRLGYVSYARDLPRYDLVVHHGGAGVTAHTLAAGLPAVVSPVDYDQFDVASRLEVAGAALRLRRLAGLPAAVARALADPGPAAAARRLQTTIQAGGTEERIAERVRRRVSPGLGPCPDLPEPEHVH